MSQHKQIEKVTRPHRILSYFKLELWPLTLVTISGVLYNIGMVAGPYFEGRLAQCLFDIMKGNQVLSAMVSLAITYLAVILFVQLMRCIKRFYIRRFANDTSRNMRHMLYNSLVNMNNEELERESLGTVMTKTVADVDACVEGMRKFTTEVFDTGVVLVAYLAMLFFYDWRLAKNAPGYYYFCRQRRCQAFWRSAGTNRTGSHTLQRTEYFNFRRPLFRC